MGEKWDFSGWATRNDVRCSDGRIIRHNAFADCDGAIVPLVWNHQHNDPLNVLGHALLENRNEGVYAYCSFNETEAGKSAKEQVAHGDITALSIYANKLKQRGSDVIHGMIREVSLVLAGANPEAFIDTIAVAHSDDSDNEEEAYIFTGLEFELSHADEEEKKLESAPEPTEKKEMEPMAEKERTIKEIFDTLNDEQKQAVYAIVGQAVEDAKAEKDGSDEDEGEDMKHNIFENDTHDEKTVLSHSDMAQIIADGKRNGSLREAFNNFLDANGLEGAELAHAITDDAGNSVEYGIANINYLFPDYKNYAATPEWIKRQDEWVGKVMNGVHRTPFSRVKSLFADITMDDARAKGYIKGNYKKEEVFALLKRATDPTTVYKKQKLDRDDVIDITDFDVVSWIKGEMRVMLNEELARAILIGDGRPASSDDKIDPNHIRPIWTDADLFTVSKVVEFADTDTKFDKANAVIDAAIEAQEDYTGSGNAIAFCTKRWLTNSLLMRNSIGERVYKSKKELADEMGVADIIPVPQFNNQTRTVDGVTRTLELIAVNLNDYNMGADKGGAVNLFDDFDIDYNRQKYLIETRCSGALVKPHSAIIIESVEAAD